MPQFEDGFTAGKKALLKAQKLFTVARVAQTVSAVPLARLLMQNIHRV